MKGFVLVFLLLVSSTSVFGKMENAVGVGVATGAVTMAPGAALSAVGFTTGGVLKGSFAAAAHSAIGNVAAGSGFAVLQSIGATGVLTVGAPFALGAAVVGGGLYCIFG